MNYGYLHSAVEFYRNRGYVFVEDAPWLVEKAAYYSTRPLHTFDISLTEDNPLGLSRFLVASGEQSFIQMMLDGRPLKRAVCVTPCYRAERYNDWHKPYFMKAELINAQDVDEGHLLHMIHDACSFFESHEIIIRVVKTDIGFDIIEKGTRVELGSYGIRKVSVLGKDLSWIYGTGCAEPRMSTTIQRMELSVGR